MPTLLDVQGRRTVGYLVNKTLGSVAKGDVVIVDSSNDEAFTSSTAGAEVVAVGVVAEENGIASNASGRVVFAGYVSVVNLNASGTRGHFIKTHTVAKQATDAGASRVIGVFGQLLTTGATPSAWLFGLPDGSTGAGGLAGGTPALTFGTANSAGAAASAIRTDATLAIFDATAPVTQAFGDAAAVGAAGVAARRDHKHGMPASPALGAWTDFTPTWLASSVNPTLGNATLQGRYKSLDANTCLIWIHFIRGSTSANGTGNYRFGGFPVVSAKATIAYAMWIRAGVAYYPGMATISAGSAQTGDIPLRDGSVLGTASPAAPATSDEFYLFATLEV